MTDPDLALGPFSITVNGRSRPNSSDFWDGNWLIVTATIITPNAQVEASGAILRNTEIKAFGDQIRELLQAGSGSAKLACLEPNLQVEIVLNQLGHADTKITITPDHLNQNHTFRIVLDRTYLTPVRLACASILRKYPIVGL